MLTHAETAIDEPEAPQDDSPSGLDLAVSDEPAKPRSQSILAGALVGIIIAIAVLAAIAGSGAFTSEGPQVVNAGVFVTETRPTIAGRTNCAEIGVSDLRSPAEGLWFQTNCTRTAGTQANLISTTCNRTSLDNSFTQVAPGLFVSRLNAGSQGFLWYSESETCFDLVSARIVTAVCVDQTVSFDWRAGSGCSSHGGVLVLVNGR